MNEHLAYPVDQVRRADEEALLASRAFVYGEFDSYLAAMRAQVVKDIEVHYASTASDTGGGVQGESW